MVLDGNLSHGALQKSCEIATKGGVPVWFEPVSAVKAERAAGLMHHMTYVSPNAQELIAMANAERRRLGRPDLAAPVLRPHDSMPQQLLDLAAHVITILEAGVRYVFLTLGPRGVAVWQLSPVSSVPPREGPGSAVSPSGQAIIRKIQLPTFGAPSIAAHSPAVPVGASRTAGSVYPLGQTLGSTQAVHREPPSCTEAVRRPGPGNSQVAGIHVRNNSEAGPMDFKGDSGAGLMETLDGTETVQSSDPCGTCSTQSAGGQPISGGGESGHVRTLRLLVSHMGALPARVVNTSGAGDCLVASAVASLVLGSSVDDAAALGLVRLIFQGRNGGKQTR
eukprot:jgi/Botrbrau1/18139/Bobra.53_1s0014.3